MSREIRVYPLDIIEAVDKAIAFSEGLTPEGLASDDLRRDAVLRNLEVVGEAVKKLPESLRQRSPTVQWKKIAGLRDILIHEYFSIDIRIVWDVLRHKLPPLRAEIERLLREGSPPP